MRIYRQNALFWCQRAVRGFQACRVLAYFSLLFLAACQHPVQFHSVDVSGADYAKGFSLVDGAGKTRTLAEFHGKLVAVFFGYTHCPDLCPTVLADFAEAKRQMGKDGDRLQVLFITLDPERDTGALLDSYVPKFDPSFIGLRGSAEQTAAVARDFKVFYRKVPGSGPDDYLLDHTAATYVYDPEGKLRLFVRYNTPVPDLVADLRLLLD